MAQFMIRVIETASRTVLVEADNLDAAYEKLDEYIDDNNFPTVDDYDGIEYYPIDAPIDSFCMPRTVIK